MKVTPIKTPVVEAGDNLFELIKHSVATLPEKSILVITSKVIALCEGRIKPIVAKTRSEKHQLAKQEADYYLDATHSQYDMLITIKDSIVAVNAGIDESNADGQYVLLPERPYESARKVWEFLHTEYHLNAVGVLITDSKTIPLKWGTMGTALSHCGFAALNNKIGEPDLFGHVMQMTQVNVAEGLAAAAVVEMGEVAESQPLCLIEDAQMVEFQDHPPTRTELEAMKIELADDVYGPLLTIAPWKKGGLQ